MGRFMDWQTEARPKKGENWIDVRKRLLNFLRDIEKKYKSKRILIISHGDPLWLFEGIIKRKTNQELLDQVFKYKNFKNNHYIEMGELRKIS